MTDLLLGLDVGTASSKGELLRPDGSLVADARADHAMDISRPGWAEEDGDLVWWADVRGGQPLRRFESRPRAAAAQS